jgi:hypothetical protein
MDYTPEHLDYEAAYTENPADDVPYQPERTITLRDTTGRVHEHFRSRAHENIIRTLRSIGWREVVRHDERWVDVEEAS